jgi:hypothetical protein
MAQSVTGLQGHHVIPQQIADLFKADFARYLPGWTVNGAYNLAPRAVNPQIASVGWEVPRAFARVHPPHHARKIREQIKTGTFPIRLKGEDWQSGEINWLLDVIAPDAKATGQVIANFRQVAKEGDLRVHPLVAGLVDAEMRD